MSTVHEATEEEIAALIKMVHDYEPVKIIEFASDTRPKHVHTKANVITLASL